MLKLIKEIQENEKEIRKNREINIERILYTFRLDHLKEALDVLFFYDEDKKVEILSDYNENSYELTISMFMSLDENKDPIRRYYTIELKRMNNEDISEEDFEERCLELSVDDSGVTLETEDDITIAHMVNIIDKELFEAIVTDWLEEIIEEQEKIKELMKN